jgi:hypothetical protein
MTADAPYDKTLTGKYTTEGDLVRDLKAHNINHELTHGKYNGVPETSVIAYDMPIDLAHALSKKYGQESFVHVDPVSGGAKLVYSNGAGNVDPTDDKSPKIPLEGTMHKETGTPELFDNAPEDYFTFIPSAGKFIRIGFDFDKRHQAPHMKNEELATHKPEENDMAKNEYTIEEVKAEIAKVLKKHMEEHENFLLDLKKKELEKKSPPGHERQVEHIAESYEKKGKSPGQAKAIAAATAWKQHGEEKKGHKHSETVSKAACEKCGKAECVCKGGSCKKCGTMMKAGECMKCGDMSRGKPTEKNEAVSFMDKKGDKSAKGPQETPDKTKEAAEASGSGGDVTKGKLGKSEIELAVETLAELDAAFNSLFKKEESSEESEETSSPERSSHEETSESEESKKNMDKSIGAGRMAATGAFPPPSIPSVKQDDKKGEAPKGEKTKKAVHNIY